MRKRRILFKTFVRPKEYEYREDNCSYALGASHNLAPTNNNPLVVCCSGPQDHCVTRGFMAECSPTLNAAAEPWPTLQTAHHHACAIIKRKKAYGIDQQGGKGGANFTEDVAPTICSDSHGTPHGVCHVKSKHPIVLNFQGSKGNNVVSSDGACPTITRMHGNDSHVVCVARRRICC